MNKKNGGHPAADVIEVQIDSFVAELKKAGYATQTLYTKHAALRSFANWRRHRKIPVTELDESHVTKFMARSCQLGPRHRCLASTALAGFLEHLRLHQVIHTSAPEAPATASSVLERRYADFLRDEKGLAELSLRVYLPLVPDLLHNLEKELGTISVHRLNATILRDFLLERARGRSSEYVRLLATSLRSFLRFLHARGEIRHDLTAAIPTVRKWSQPGVPRKLTPEEIDRVLAAPDRTTPTGRRDYAILLLLARLGLRSGEVIALELRDIRWNTGEILIRGKGSRLDLLPLSCEVGAAIACYLRVDRGIRPMQRVFLRTYAPRVPLTGPASVGHIVRRALAHAGVERPNRIAAHLFRHTLASRMLQQGADLREISEVLRHRAPSTTEVYAKIDFRSLNEVVRPWPARGGAR
jgi:integrase/recombinase XerD